MRNAAPLYCKVTIIHFIFVLFYCLGQQPLIFAWSDKVTHPQLTKFAAEKKSNIRTQLIDNLGFDGKYVETNILPTILQGSELEDAETRALNHFHEPISNTGLDDWSVVPPYHWTGNSNLAWAIGEIDSNAYSWKKAREAYYAGLIAKSEAEREQLFADAFRSIGQVLHLVEDMAVPAHTRNDMKGHILFQRLSGWSPRSWFGNNFEAYVQKHPGLINALGAAADTKSFASLSDFWDANAYDGSNIQDSLHHGLAEYSSANFVSTESMFDEFPHPALTDTNYSQLALPGPEDVLAEDGKVDKRLYIKSVTGENINHLACIGYLTNALAELGGRPYFVLDDECHREYAQKLIPKAIGYTAGVLNYFFRGNLEISQAALGAPAGDEIPSITVAVRNATPGEEIMAGELVAVARYKTDAAGTAYSFVISDSIPINALSSADPEKFSFDFSADPLPLHAEESSVQVLFKGTMGNEENAAVAVGMKQLLRQHVVVQVSCSGITMALVWDILLNQPAAIEDAGGQTISFPCDLSALAPWQSKTRKVGLPLWDILAGADNEMKTLSCSVDCDGGNYKKRVTDECNASNSAQSRAVDENGSPYINTAEASASCASGGPMPNPDYRKWDSAGSYHVHASLTKEYYSGGDFRFILDSPAARLRNRNSYPAVCACFRTEEQRNLLTTMHSPGPYDDAGKEEEQSQSATYAVLTPFGTLATFEAASHNWASILDLGEYVTDGSNSGTNITDGRYGFAHVLSTVAIVQIYAAQARTYSFSRPCGWFGDGAWVGQNYNGYTPCALQSQSRTSTPIYVHAQCDFAGDAANANPLGYGRNSGFEQEIQTLIDAVLARVTKPTNEYLPAWMIAAEIRE